MVDAVDLEGAGLHLCGLVANPGAGMLDFFYGGFAGEPVAVLAADDLALAVGGDGADVAFVP